MNLFSTKKLFNLLLIIFFLTGSLSSLNVGISHDEWHEEQNWKFNLDIIKKTKNKIFFDEKDNLDLDSNLDKYYGVGFQFISQPIQSLLKSNVQKYQGVSDFGAKLLSKHFIVFSFFFISGLIFFKIIKKVTNDRNFSYLSTYIYLLYPYLLGHSFFSPKDIPFMSVWLLCTYLSLKFFEIILQNKSINYLRVAILAICTAFLLSIRVTGVLIFFQYIFTFLIFLNIKKISLLEFIEIYYKKFLYFLFLLFLFIFILNPVYWYSPLSFFSAIKWMSHYYHDICTDTLGSCMSAKNLPSTYMLIWFAVKLPLIILLGIFLVPFSERKIFKEKKASLIFGTLLSSIIFTPLILIIINANLYDEIRHVMFLMPLIFIVSVTSLYYFSKKIFYILGCFSIALFLIENFKIHPYQYVWFNTPSRILDLTKKFELEYMGISGREISKSIISLNENKACILASPGHTVEPFFFETKYDCFDKWQLIDTNYSRPFLAIQHVRNIKKGKPFNCKIISNEGFKLLFHEEKFITGKLLKCF